MCHGPLRVAASGLASESGSPRLRSSRSLVLGSFHCFQMQALNRRSTHALSVRTLVGVSQIEK